MNTDIETTTKVLYQRRILLLRQLIDKTGRLMWASVIDVADDNTFPA